MTEYVLAPDAALLVASRSQGLWLWRQGPAGWDGRLTGARPGLSALALHPHLPVVYATAGSGAGRVLALALPDGALLSEADSGGTEPAHLAVDPSGRVLIVANYESGTLASWHLAADGALEGAPQILQLTGSGPDPDRQQNAHPHQVLFREDGAVVVLDLGADLLREYRLDMARPALEAAAVAALPAGAGPRHGVFVAGGRLAISAELGNGLLLGAGDGWQMAAATMLERAGHARFARNYPGDIAPGHGAMVHMANRSLGTLATFDTEGETPRLVGEVETGVDWPQHLLLHGDHLLVAGEDSGKVVALPLRDGLPGAPEVLFDCADACWLALMQSGAGDLAG